MKKVLSAILAVMLIASMAAMATVSGFAADAVVYVDGAKGKDVADGATGAKDNPFNNLPDAFAALENGGTITIIGDVDPMVKLTTYKTQKDEDGNVTDTDELQADRVDLIAKGNVVITSDGGAINFVNAGSIFFNHYGNVSYSKATINFNGAGRVMFSAYNGHFVMDDASTVGGKDGNYLYGNGYIEWNNAYSLNHFFVNYMSGAKYATKADTVLVFGKDAKAGTIWNGLGAITTNFAMYVKDNAAITAFNADGQASSHTGIVLLYIEGNGSIGTIKADGNAAAGKPEKVYQSGGTLGEGFKAMSEYAVKPEAVTTNAALFNKVTKEVKVTGDANSFVTVDGIAAGTKLYTIVDGAPVEASYTLTSAGTALFSTVEGVTNYVFADDLKKAEEEKPGTSVPTGDPIVIVAIVAAVSLAGAFVFKKVR